MLDGVPQLWQKSCPVEDGRFQFLTKKEVEVWETAKSLKTWVEEGFNMIDFPFPKWLDIDCNTAREILARAWLLRTKKLDS